MIAARPPVKLQKTIGARRSAVHSRTTSFIVMAQHAPAGEKKVVIVGGGIVGASCAYYLSAKMGASDVTVLERESVACAASGKAGGFLALDWNDSSPVGPLARTSYALHEQLAQAFGADAIGYRKVHTLQVSAAVAAKGDGAAASPKQQQQQQQQSGLPGWIDGAIGRASVMGTPDTTAQVHPSKLTHALMAAAQAAGCRLVKGCADGLQLEAGSSGRVAGVVLGDGTTLPADVIVLAMGPWSRQAAAWLQQAAAAAGDRAAAALAAGALDVHCLKYHSIVMRPAAEASITNHMLFTSVRLMGGGGEEPEVYPRPDGTVYVCGKPQAQDPPADPSRVQVERGLCDDIAQLAGAVSSHLRQAPIEAMQACYLPCSADDLPVIGPLGPSLPGVYVATGHSCWGILNGPATGLAVAEMIVQGATTSVNVARLSPQRFASAGRR